MIGTSTARVYHGGGRRWFTPRAALRAEAHQRLRQRWCACCDDESCALHEVRDEGDTLAQRISERYARRFSAALRRVADGTITGPARSERRQFRPWWGCRVRVAPPPPRIDTADDGEEMPF